jgi:asparaginyl-tRNA synthetase
MEKISVADARKAEAVGKQVRLQGWVRTRRDSKGGFSFIELNDGSSQGNVQVVAPGELPNYESVVKHLHTGASVVIEGEVKASPAKGQATEVLASRVEMIGDAPVETYPLQK